MTALVMLMGQDRTADDRQVRVGSDEVVRQDLDELKQPAEGHWIDLHRHMILFQQDAVLLIVGVRAVLQIPVLALQMHRDLSQVLPCRMIEASRVAHVFRAKQALRIARALHSQQLGDHARILLRLGEVDRDLHVAVAARGFPVQILLDPLRHHIVVGAGEMVEIFGSFLRVFRLKRLEGFRNLRRSRRQKAHDLRVHQVAVGHVFSVDHAPIDHVIQDLLQDRIRRVGRRFLAGLRVSHLTGHHTIGFLIRDVKLQQIQQLVADVNGILRFDQAMIQPVGQQLFHEKLDRLIDALHALTGFRHVKLRCQPGFRFIVLSDRLNEFIDRFFLHKCDGAAAEARAGHTRAKRSRDLPRLVHHGVKLFARHLVQIAQGVVRLVHQLAESRQVALFKHLDRFLNARVLVHCVLCAFSRNRIADRGFVGFKLSRAQVAERLDRNYLLQIRECLFALRTAFIVFTVRQAALFLGIADDDLYALHLQRDIFIIKRGTVKKDRL